MSARAEQGRIVLAGEPRVQLLPPSVRARAKSRELRRLMVLLVILAVVVVGAGTFAAYLRATQADAALAGARAETLRLLSEQSQYSEGATIAGLVAASEQAQRLATSNEVLWRGVTVELGRLLEPENTIEAVTYTARAPWEPEMAVEGALRGPRVATAIVTIQGPEIPDAVRLSRGLATLTGYADSVIRNTTLDSGLYHTTIAVTFDADVLSARFAGADDEDVESASTPDPEATEGAQP